ncbi:MAG: Rid family detoxifying hydrolase [Candidatus Aminicenantes bacterium]|nr:Rid family detoxifying hydrolase [Candidatus Aminicenantes bacterium]
MKKHLVNTRKAPPAIGPYSQGIQAGNLIFLSMQLGIDPESKKLAEGGITAQTRQILSNLKEILRQAGATMEQVIKTTVFIKDMTNFKTVNEIYSRYFEAPYPVRSVIAIKELPLSAEIGIDAIALLEVKKGE